METKNRGYGVKLLLLDFIKGSCCTLRHLYLHHHQLQASHKQYQQHYATPTSTFNLHTSQLNCHNKVPNSTITMKFLILSALTTLALSLPAQAATCNFKATHRAQKDGSRVDSWARYYFDPIYFGTIHIHPDWPVPKDQIVSFPNGPRFLYNINTDTERCQVSGSSGGDPGRNKLVVTDKGDYTEYNCYVLGFDC